MGLYENLLNEDFTFQSGYDLIPVKKGVNHLADAFAEKYPWIFKKIEPETQSEGPQSIILENEPDNTEPEIEPEIQLEIEPETQSEGPQSIILENEPDNTEPVKYTAKSILGMDRNELYELAESNNLKIDKRKGIKTIAESIINQLAWSLD